MATSPYLGRSLETNIEDGEITNAKLAPNCVNASKIEGLSVNSAALGNNAVTNAKLGASSVSAAKLGASSVTNAKIQNGAVQEDKIASFAVTSTKIGANAVTNAKINNGAVTSIKIGANAVTADKINVETGVWTPELDSVSTGVTASGQTYDNQVGKYQKTGKHVLATFSLKVLSIGTLSGGLYIHNLPFLPMSGGPALYYAVNVSHALSLNGWIAGHSLVGHMQAGQPWIRFYAWNSTSGTGGVGPSTLNQGASWIIGQASYYTN